MAVNTTDITVDGVVMDNVIKFPGREPEEGVDRLPNTLEEVKANVEAVRHVHINEITEIVMSTMVQQFMAGGFNILDDEHRKDFGFLIEAIRSSLCKTVKMYHPFQDVSEKVMEEHDDSGIMTIANGISVKFQNDESPDDEGLSVPEESSQILPT
jgi:hypothetical protein